MLEVNHPTDLVCLMSLDNAYVLRTHCSQRTLAHCDELDRTLRFAETTA